jgi:hypothetical protein
MGINRRSLSSSLQKAKTSLALVGGEQDFVQNHKLEDTLADATPFRNT